MKWILKQGVSLLLAGMTLWACASFQGSGSSRDSGISDSQKGSRMVSGLSRRSEALFKDAVSHWEEQKKINVIDWEELEKRFLAVVEEEEKFSEAYFNLGWIYENQQRWGDAKASYAKALAIKPSLKQATENLAALYEREGKLADALALYQNAIQFFPDDSSLRGYMAEIYRRTGDFNRALYFAREALIRAPQSLVAYKVLMRVYFERNNLPMSRLVALRGSKISPDPEFFLVLGQIALKEGHEEIAVIQFVRAIKENNDFLPARVELARVQAGHNAWVNVVEQYRKIVEIEPKNVGARINLGLAYRGLGQVDKAMSEFDALVKTYPEIPEPKYYLATILHKDKNVPERALEYYQKFISQSKNAVAADHPVYENMKQCEMMLRQLAELKSMEQQVEKKKNQQGNDGVNARAKTELPSKEASGSPKESDKKLDTKSSDTKPNGSKKSPVDGQNLPNSSRYDQIDEPADPLQ